MAKHFRDDSIVKIFPLLDIIGINDSKLISNAIQAPNEIMILLLMKC